MNNESGSKFFKVGVVILIVTNFILSYYSWSVMKIVAEQTNVNRLHIENVEKDVDKLNGFVDELADYLQDRDERIEELENSNWSKLDMNEKHKKVLEINNKIRGN